jgi:hypothetical protein
VPVAVLDACVLFQGRVTNLLLHLAEAKAFEPIWSADIHAEWMLNLHSSMGIPIDKNEYRRGEMESAFPAPNVPAPPTLVATIQAVSKTGRPGFSDCPVQANIPSTGMSTPASASIVRSSERPARVTEV